MFSSRNFVVSGLNMRVFNPFGVDFGAWGQIVVKFWVDFGDGVRWWLSFGLILVMASDGGRVLG